LDYFHELNIFKIKHREIYREKLRFQLRLLNSFLLREIFKLFKMFKDYFHLRIIHNYSFSKQ